MHPCPDKVDVLVLGRDYCTNYIQENCAISVMERTQGQSSQYSSGGCSLCGFTVINFHMKGSSVGVIWDYQFSINSVCQRPLEVFQYLTAHGQSPHSHQIVQSRSASYSFTSTIFLNKPHPKLLLRWRIFFQLHNLCILFMEAFSFFIDLPYCAYSLLTNPSLGLVLDKGVSFSVHLLVISIIG